MTRLVTAKPCRRNWCAKAAAVPASSEVKLSSTRRCWSRGGVGVGRAAEAVLRAAGAIWGAAAAVSGCALGVATGGGAVAAFAIAG